MRQFSSTTTGLMAIGIFSTLVVVVGYRKVIEPNMNRRRREEAEAVANFIFQHEVQKEAASNK